MSTEKARPLAVSVANALNAIQGPNGPWHKEAVETRPYNAGIHAALLANLAAQFMVPVGTDLGDGKKVEKAYFDKAGFQSTLRSEPLCEQSNFKQSRLEPLGLVASKAKKVEVYS